MSDMVEATFHAIFEPRWARGTTTRVMRMEFVRATKNRPSSLRNGGVAVKLTVQMPKNVFMPLQPEAVITVTPGQATVILAEAVDPDNHEEHTE